MSTALITIFILALAAIAVQSLTDVRRDRLGSASPRGAGRKLDWIEVAGLLDLEMVLAEHSDRVLRGTVGDHWSTIETVDAGVQINMNYRSGSAPFTIEAKDRSSASSPASDSVTQPTGDEAFDAGLLVATASVDKLGDYLSPARRNALLWLTSAFELNSVNDEQISVVFTRRRWNPEEIVSAVRLVEDVADILEEGEKVFMSPPLPVSAEELDQDA